MAKTNKIEPINEEIIVPDVVNEEIVVPEKMDEQPNQEQPQYQKIKQYLLVVDDMHMVFIGKLMPGLRFIEVDGMNLENNKDVLLLVSPVAKQQPSSDITSSDVM